MFVTENDSSAIIVKRINYNIPWRDGTIVLVVTSTCLLPITTTPDREIVYERIRFCNKDFGTVTAQSERHKNGSGETYHPEVNHFL